MKQFFSVVFKLLGVLVLIVLGILLVLKIKNDTIAEKQKQEKAQNIQIESEYYIKEATSKFEQIKKSIENDIGSGIELAETGSISKIDLYFVANVDDEYKYIVKNSVDNIDKFEISKESDDDNKYIISIDVLGFKDCVYTKLENYNIDKDGKITYVNI